MIRALILLPAVLAALVAAASLNAAPAKTIVTVRLNDSRLVLGAPSAPRWFVNFAVSNRGTVPHEFVIVKTATAAWKLPVKAGKADETGRVRRFGTLQPGERRQHGLNLTPGRYVLLCNLPGHYQAGQRVGFTVTTT